MVSSGAMYSSLDSFGSARTRSRASGDRVHAAPQIDPRFHRESAAARGLWALEPSGAEPALVAPAPRPEPSLLGQRQGVGGACRERGHTGEEPCPRRASDLDGEAHPFGNRVNAMILKKIQTDLGENLDIGKFWEMLRANWRN